mmetsp:Transcript_6379/g.15413  ORF Transcript_6379/g.15413 Transcript_6379/m.15413 type:complete len:202 (-) Transcript_6379:272-877(-)
MEVAQFPVIYISPAANEKPQNFVFIRIAAFRLRILLFASHLQWQLLTSICIDVRLFFHQIPNYWIRPATNGEVQKQPIFFLPHTHCVWVEVHVASIHEGLYHLEICSHAISWKILKASSSFFAFAAPFSTRSRISLSVTICVLPCCNLIAKSKGARDSLLFSLWLSSFWIRAATTSGLLYMQGLLCIPCINSAFVMSNSGS